MTFIASKYQTFYFRSIRFDREITVDWMTLMLLVSDNSLRNSLTHPCIFRCCVSSFFFRHSGAITVVEWVLCFGLLLYVCCKRQMKKKKRCFNMLFSIKKNFPYISLNPLGGGRWYKSCEKFSLFFSFSHLIFFLFSYFFPSSAFNDVSWMLLMLCINFSSCVFWGGRIASEWIKACGLSFHSARISHRWCVRCGYIMWKNMIEFSQHQPSDREK